MNELVVTDIHLSHTHSSRLIYALMRPTDMVTHKQGVEMWRKGWGCEHCAFHKDVGIHDCLESLSLLLPHNHHKHMCITEDCIYI